MGDNRPGGDGMSPGQAAGMLAKESRHIHQGVVGMWRNRTMGLETKYEATQLGTLSQHLSLGWGSVTGPRRRKTTRISSIGDRLERE